MRKPPASMPPSPSHENTAMHANAALLLYCHIFTVRNIPRHIIDKIRPAVNQNMPRECGFSLILWENAADICRKAVLRSRKQCTEETEISIDKTMETPV